MPKNKASQCWQLFFFTIDLAFSLFSHIYFILFYNIIIIFIIAIIIISLVFVFLIMILISSFFQKIWFDLIYIGALCCLHVGLDGWEAALVGQLQMVMAKG